MEERIKQLEVLTREMVKYINSFNSAETVPFSLSNALASRVVGTSSKTAASETQAVNEGSTAQYSVCKPPDAFGKVTVGGKDWGIPLFDL